MRQRRRLAFTGGALAMIACVLVLSAFVYPVKANSSGTTDSFAFFSIDAPCVGCPGGVATQTVVNGIDAAGDVVGAYLDAQGQQHGFLLSGGHFTTIDVPGALATNARGIGPGGDIVGNYVASPGTSVSDIKGFLYDHGTLTTVTFPGHPGAIVARITPDGTMYGCFHDFDVMGSMFSAVWSRSGNTSLAAGGGELSDPTASVPDSMHGGATPDGSTVVGFYTDMATGHQHGYIVQAGSLQSYDVPGSTRTAIWDINASADFVGLYRDSTGTHGFLQPSDTLAPISIDFPGATATMAFGINSGGAVVGQYRDAGGVTHGFLALPISPE